MNPGGSEFGGMEFPVTCSVPKVKAVLTNVDLPRPKQVFTQTTEQAQKWAEEILDGLTETQRKTAYVRISESRDVLLMDIHPAVEVGEFAIADYRKKEEPAA